MEYFRNIFIWNICSNGHITNIHLLKLIKYNDFEQCANWKDAVDDFNNEL